MQPAAPQGAPLPTKWPAPHPPAFYYSISFNSSHPEWRDGVGGVRLHSLEGSGGPGVKKLSQVTRFVTVELGTGPGPRLWPRERQDWAADAGGRCRPAPAEGCLPRPSG